MPGASEQAGTILAIMLALFGLFWLISEFRETHKQNTALKTNKKKSLINSPAFRKLVRKSSFSFVFHPLRFATTCVARILLERV
jgi:hypothetical protein